MTNPYDRELTLAEKKTIETMMELNPVLDRLIAETLVLMPEEDLKEIVEQSKTDTLPPDEWVKEHTEFVLKTGTVSDPDKDADS